MMVRTRTEAETSPALDDLTCNKPRRDFLLWNRLYGLDDAVVGLVSFVVCLGNENKTHAQSRSSSMGNRTGLRDLVESGDSTLPPPTNLMSLLLPFLDLTAVLLRTFFSLAGLLSQTKSMAHTIRLSQNFYVIDFLPRQVHFC